MASVDEFIKDPSDYMLDLFLKQKSWKLVEHSKISDVDKCEKLVNLK